MFSNLVETGRVKDEDGKDVNTKRREDEERASEARTIRRTDPVGILALPWTSIMLRALPASVSSRSRSLVPLTRRTRPQTTTVTVRYRQVHTPTTPAAPTTRTNEPNALPLSDAQRRTIYALSTPPGRSGVAVIRVSGPNVLGVWQRMVRPARTAARRASTHHDLRDAHRHGKHSDETLTRQRHPEPQKLERCHIVDPHTAEHLDDALAVFFRGASALIPAPFASTNPAELPLTRLQPPARSRPKTSWNYTYTADAPSSAQC